MQPLTHGTQETHSSHRTFTGTQNVMCSHIGTHIGQNVQYTL